jgi:mono/diheme cytochrome c family protein
MKPRLPGWSIAVLSLVSAMAAAGDDGAAGAIASSISQNCVDCHNPRKTKGGLDLSKLALDLVDSNSRARWIQIYDRIQKGEMPPEPDDLPGEERKTLVALLGAALGAADLAEVVANGRGPMRRLNREEYENNLRDLLQLPNLDIRDMLPEDRAQNGFNKSARALDISRVQLAAYLDAADAALRAAMASGGQPPAQTRYEALATEMFPSAGTFGNREAMFYARDSKMLPLKEPELTEIRKSGRNDPNVEMALFRSASWPYFGYPHGFIAKTAGEYRVRFFARAVLQIEGFQLLPATKSAPMTFRARAPSGADVSGDVRATGGIMDITPEGREYETQVRLRAGETFEYSLLGLPVPVALNVNNGPPTYRYPPFPEGGQPGVAFRSIEITGPIPPKEWPPASHRVLFDDLPIRNAASPKEGLPVEVISADPKRDAVRLLRRFAQLAAREPVPEEALPFYEKLILREIDEGAPLAEAMLAGYKAFLCSGHFLYLREPVRAGDHQAIASRLSHFLSNSRPDAALAGRARAGEMRNAQVLRAETDRLIDGPAFDRFVENFTDYWLDLKDLRRDAPDIRLYPEYRLDDYLIESLGEETRAFFTAMVRENLPAAVMVTSDFAFVNDRLSIHYGMAPVEGSRMRKVALSKSSPYGGLLTQGAVLRVTSNGTTTSPVIRGAWIMARIMGEPPPPPPPSVPAVEPDIRGAKTIRDLLAMHTKSKTCAACHARFDPVGLALENFDIMGAWRDRYRGLEKGERVTGIDRAGHDFAYTMAESVDSAGTLLDGRSFKNISDLKAILAGNPRQLARNLLRQFTVYATGSPVRFSDRAEIEAILDECQPSGYRVRDLLRGFVCSRIFLGQAGCQASTSDRLSTP